MAKKKGNRPSPVTIIDEEGYETDGMYRWGGPTQPFDPETLQKWLEESEREFNLSATERIEKWHSAMTQLITSHADGPLTTEEANEIYNRTLVHITMPNGGESGLYALHEDVPAHGYVDDAIDVNRHLGGLAKLIAESPPNLNLIVRSAFYIGALISRLDLRARFAQKVLSAKKRSKASAKGGKATARFTAEVRTKAEPIFRQYKRAKISDESASKKTSAKLMADFGLDISYRTIRRHLATKKA
jgi:hypothetical protein